MTTRRPRLSPPPVGEWSPLDDRSGGRGYLSIYYSDPIARYPIRQVTRPHDNKSDPNIETGTYGLFSTCEKIMRKRVVQDGLPFIFFATSHGKHPRSLTGFYRVGWFTTSTDGSKAGDYALAAAEMRFIDPIKFSQLPTHLREICEPQFRTIRPLTEDACSSMYKLLRSKPDMTADYIEEIHRLERFNLQRTDYAYPSWLRREGFTWGSAEPFVVPAGQPEPRVNSSKNLEWLCTSDKCRQITKNYARLKQCPHCGAMGTLIPALEGEY